MWCVHFQKAKRRENILQRASSRIEVDWVISLEEKSIRNVPKRGRLEFRTGLMSLEYVWSSLSGPAKQDGRTVFIMYTQVVMCLACHFLIGLTGPDRGPCGANQDSSCVGALEQLSVTFKTPVISLQNFVLQFLKINWDPFFSDHFTQVVAMITKTKIIYFEIQ